MADQDAVNKILDNFLNLPPAVQQVILDGPGMLPPTGVTPNFVNPPNHNRAAIAVAVVCLVFVSAATLSRIYSRVFITKKVELQDCAYCFSISALSSLLTGCVRFRPCRTCRLIASLSTSQALLVPFSLLTKYDREPI